MSTACVARAPVGIGCFSRSGARGQDSDHADEATQVSGQGGAGARAARLAREGAGTKDMEVNGFVIPDHQCLADKLQ